MKVIPLQSGSNGNCTYVQVGDIQLLFDAGISGRQAQQRLAAHGREITSVDALVISHDHRDHASAMGIYQRKFGVPVFVTEQTLAAADSNLSLGKLNDVRQFSAGNTLRFGAVTVETIRTPHDGVDGVGFVVDDGRCRLGILTDLGHVFRELESLVATLDAVVLESNYDPEWLDCGPYPYFLKQRIRGGRGHLSNEQAAGVLRAAMGQRLQWACLAHLSGENNSPDLALTTHREILGDGLPLHIAHRDQVSDLLEVARD